jgi:hypothetical protein
VKRLVMIVQEGINVKLRPPRVTASREKERKRGRKRI